MHDMVSRLMVGVMVCIMQMHRVCVGWSICVVRYVCGVEWSKRSECGMEATTVYRFRLSLSCMRFCRHV